MRFRKCGHDRLSPTWFLHSKEFPEYLVAIEIKAIPAAGDSAHNTNAPTKIKAVAARRSIKGHLSLSPLEASAYALALILPFLLSDIAPPVYGAISCRHRR
jgi:hypothetical protein